MRSHYALIQIQSVCYTNYNNNSNCCVCSLVNMLIQMSKMVIQMNKALMWSSIFKRQSKLLQTFMTLFTLNDNTLLIWSLAADCFVVREAIWIIDSTHSGDVCCMCVNSVSPLPTVVTRQNQEKRRVLSVERFFVGASAYSFHWASQLAEGAGGTIRL